MGWETKKRLKMSSIQKLLLLCLAISSTYAFKTQLYRRDSYRQKIIQEKNWPEFRKINKELVKRYESDSIGQFGSSNQPLYDFADQMYFVRISAGTPPQEFEVLFETASGTTWFIDNTCNGSYIECPLFCQVSYDYCKSACEDYCCNSTSTAHLADLDPCANKRQFDRKASSTYQKDGRLFIIPYGAGTVTGILGTDTITLGDSKSGIQIKNTTFGQAQKLAVEYAKVPLDGVLGLGYKITAVDGVQPIFEHGFDLGLFDEPVFTVRLVNEGADSRDEKGGDLSLGNRDPENCAGDANFIPIAVAGFWSFNVDAVGPNGQKNKKSQFALISFGTPLMLLSYEDLMDLTVATSAYYNFDFGMYQVDCNSKFSWSIYVGDNELKVENENLVWKLDDGTCLLAASDWGEAAHPVDLIVAVPFLRQFCSIFDVKNGKVGFATKLNNS